MTKLGQNNRYSGPDSNQVLSIYRCKKTHLLILISAIDHNLYLHRLNTNLVKEKQVDRINQSHCHHHSMVAQQNSKSNKSLYGHGRSSFGHQQTIY